MKTSIIRSTGRRIDYITLPGLLNAVVEMACYLLDIPEDTKIIVDYLRAPRKSGIEHTFGLCDYVTRAVDPATRRLVTLSAPRAVVTIYAKGRTEREIAMTLAHELGHVDHLAHGALHATEGQRETWADARAMELGAALGIFNPATATWFERK